MLGNPDHTVHSLNLEVQVVSSERLVGISYNVLNPLKARLATPFKRGVLAGKIADLLLCTW